jgi:2,3,4,5-tetrahydropyridine-2-carboxylate N-succinyltransferase
VTDANNGYLDLEAWGHGLATVTDPDDDSDIEPKVLDVWYPYPTLGDPGDSHPPVGFEAPAVITSAVRKDALRGVETMVIFTAANLSQPPVDVADVYLRLHLLSHRMVTPNSVNLEGMDELLPTVVWTEMGPCGLEGFDQVQFRFRTQEGKTLAVNSISQVPRMLDYVVPTEVKIANPHGVHLGAHLAPGTSVAHGAAVEHNAGTLAPGHVTNHISSGLVLGADEKLIPESVADGNPEYTGCCGGGDSAPGQG